MKLGTSNMKRNKVKIFIILIAISEKLNSWQHAIERMNGFFLSSFNLGAAGLWETVGGKGLLLFFFSYDQNHDFS